MIDFFLWFYGLLAVGTVIVLVFLLMREIAEDQWYSQLNQPFYIDDHVEHIGFQRREGNK